MGKRKFEAMAAVSKRFKPSFAKQVAKAVVVQAAEEIKYYDTSNTILTPVALAANTAAITRVSCMGVGTGPSERVGRRVKAKYLQYTSSLYQNYNAANANIRTVVFVDTQNNGADPAYVDVFEVASVYSAPNREGKTRFKILYDNLVQVNNVNSDTSAAIQKVYIDVGKKLASLSQRPQDQMLQYLADTADSSATNGRNSVFVFVMSDVAVSSNMGTGTARSGLDFYARFAYTDA